MIDIVERECCAKSALYDDMVAENERLTTERDRWQHDALGWSDRLTDATAEIERLQSTLPMQTIGHLTTEIERLTIQVEHWKSIAESDGRKIAELRAELADCKHDWLELLGTEWSPAERKP